MSQVKSVIVVGKVSAVDVVGALLESTVGKAVELVPEVLPVPVDSKAKMTAPERRPWLYVGDQKLETLTDKQLRGEIRRAHPRGPRDMALATILQVMLDSHTRGMSPFPR